MGKAVPSGPVQCCRCPTRRALGELALCGRTGGGRTRVGAALGCCGRSRGRLLPPQCSACGASASPHLPGRPPPLALVRSAQARFGGTAVTISHLGRPRERVAARARPGLAERRGGAGATGGRSPGTCWRVSALRCSSGAFPSRLGRGDRPINGYFIYIISGVP